MTQDTAIGLLTMADLLVAYGLSNGAIFNDLEHFNFVRVRWAFLPSPVFRLDSRPLSFTVSMF